MSYLWQKEKWPDFSWDEDSLKEYLKIIRQNQGFLMALADSLTVKSMGEALFIETIESAAIEGDKLDLSGVRSSIAQKLGLETDGLPFPSSREEGIVSLLLDATTNFKEQLTAETLFGWQSALFPSGRCGFKQIEVGQWRSHQESMQIISGSMGNPTVHYEAPPSMRVPIEMSGFLKWWNDPPKHLDGFIRASIAHYWFVAIHPFSDGNGRLARALVDRAIAQEENSSIRILSLSTEIMKQRNQYYEVLEEISNGVGELTLWIKWFLQIVISAQNRAISVVQNSKKIEKFYINLKGYELKKRHLKVIDKMVSHYPKVFKGGMTNRKYISITKVSPETAKRDLKLLVEYGILIKGKSGGRSIFYVVNRDLF